MQPRVRVTLQGPLGRLDLVVDPYTLGRELLSGDVLDAVLPGGGAGAPVHAALLTRAGSVVDPQRPLEDAGVDDGDVLVVVATRQRERRRRRSGGGEGDGGPARLPAPPRRGLLAGGALALTGAAAVALGLAPGARPPFALTLLALAAGGAVLAPSTRQGDAVRLLSPLLGALAVVLLVADGEPGSLLLALCAGGVAAAVLAAAARAGGRGTDEPLVVWVVVGTVAAVVFGACLLAGTDERVGWCVLGALALPVVRLLPASVIDVPDTLLLELDRLSVTAWSAHAPGRRGRARRRLRTGDVLPTIGHGQRLHLAGTVAAAVVAAVAGVVVVLRPTPDGLAAYGMPVLVACLAAGQALCARAVRDPRSRVSLLASASVLALALAFSVLTGAGTSTVRLLAGCLVVVALLVVFASSALGRGWSSVRWARTGDVLEGLAVVLVLPAALVAAGGVEWFRQLVV